MKTILFALLFVLSTTIGFAGFPQGLDGDQCTENSCPLPEPSSPERITEFHVVCDSSVVAEAFITIKDNVAGGQKTYFFEMGSGERFRAISPLNQDESYMFEFKDKAETLIKVELMTDGCELTLIVE